MKTSKTPVIVSTVAAIVMAACLVSPISASGALLAEWTFVAGGTTRQDPSNVAPNTTAGLANWGPGYTVNSETNYGGSLNTAYSRANRVPSTFANALSGDDYLTVTLSANNGFTLNLNSFAFDLGGSNSSNGEDFTAYAQIRTSVDNFTTSLNLTPGASVEASQFISVNDSDLESTSFTGTLGSGSYQDLNEIEVRIYGYTNPNNSNSWLRLTNISFDGTVSVVPEPSSAMLLITGCGIFLMLARRRSSKG